MRATGLLHGLIDDFFSFANRGCLIWLDVLQSDSSTRMLEATFVAAVAAARFHIVACDLRSLSTRRCCIALLDWNILERIRAIIIPKASVLRWSAIERTPFGVARNAARAAHRSQFRQYRYRMNECRLPLTAVPSSLIFPSGQVNRAKSFSRKKP